MLHHLLPAIALVGLLAGCTSGEPAAPAPSGSATNAATRTLHLTDLKDGDSFIASDGVEYRVGLINTPELSACGGADAAEAGAALLASGFTAEPYATDDFDRAVARITLADGTGYGEQMARRGWADDRYLDQFRHQHPAYAAALEPAFEQAREASAGLWATCWSRDPTEAAPASTAGAAASGASSVTIAEVVWDGPGADVEFDSSEHVVLVNTGGSAVDLGGWRLSDEAGHVIVLPAGATIPADGTFRVHTGPGTDGPAAHHAGLDQAIWNNSGGDTATLATADGTIVASRSYDG